ncbi:MULTISPECIES: glutamine--fructose-6-phosphate transaminase (isomerizing) [Clostridium]|uniref:Glutamine--fructose-6-phosphate aminotransferase [isomerizing] n=1 Tax=Clostridium acetobutylicum (strain ATCC 824 / DSM 792 / JCM 1419 / IAM 19013 / LMG 5710 / NBRC 13948 / NRRL B-527 / VKM B-1787 / 2291 / W) TaxID=272562 RepID=GLMS_CLOAB|nr:MULTISPECIES: glutamine--fructose-6-phosphate transaminase (isomerizing) [Clostridium]Q97MN6.3 RecName: Full=Glutamine--fructose-6-phosphate aminotransferase [isomerizing]; AltName: Full=D-fructose-6-phosphate amidotransferase; AltName: Full=GFAT; AltName: Full=Glucosamine-6-phosphate synthase; AltName: Full=Hexosephosphate aminotransferase; AltName: Full=L-glutamine--D-fructose-6-phosphate amidotransferase [Clostridium acetobutylicum ATCC 824]AAK78142.1 Glucoseamine-fructose-6-phosphate amino
MCGIVGYSGKKEASSILVEGLSKLEYRGYDSAGVAILNDGKINVSKCKGRLVNLENKLEENPIAGNIGIGHTRWATHGEPSDLNAHPHSNKDNTISVVHNGIIENYMQLRTWLKSKGYEFKSETDTEVIPNLVDYFYEGNLLDAVIKAISKVEGSYALGIVSSKEPDKVVAVRKDSPLIVGISEDGNFIASDVPAILNHTRDIYYIKDKEFVVLTSEGVEFYSNEGEKIEKELNHIEWDANAAEKGGYEHFMLKEIYEQPKAIRDTMTSRIIAGQPIKLDDISITKEQIENIDKIYIVACGTAYHAGVVGKYVIEKFARIPVEVDIASEFRYRDPIITKNTLMIVLSQSGETADTLAALREAKSIGARVIAVTNVVGSSVARAADDILYTWAGPEIAVASTKAYTTQLITMYILGLFFAQNKNTLTNEEIEKIKADMLTLPEKAEEVLASKEKVQKFAANTYMHKDMFYLGRGIDYAVAMEGALKLKEISYIHAEAYAGGELKHGTIALIEEGTVVVALGTQSDIYDKMVSNIKEVTTRGAKVLGIAAEGRKGMEEVVDSVIYVPEVNDMLLPVLSVMQLQLLAYYVSVEKGCDVDKPRNLAKSVTVE